MLAVSFSPRLPPVFRMNGNDVQGDSMKVHYEVFRSSFQSWESLFREASAFAEKIGEQRLINISHSCDNADSVVTVWYWGK